MPANHETIAAIPVRARRSERSSFLHDVAWEQLSQEQASLTFSMLDFLGDRERALQLEEHPAFYRVTQALRKLPTIINLSEKCKKLSESFNTEKETLRNELQAYHKAIEVNSSNHEYLLANRDVALCDGYLFGLLGNVVHANIHQMWRDSFRSSFAAESLTHWVHRNLQKGERHAALHQDQPT